MPFRMIRGLTAYPYTSKFAGDYRRVSSMDSGLEAFSHNPTDDSFSSLSVRINENTNYLNQRFLSY